MQSISLEAQLQLDALLWMTAGLVTATAAAQAPAHLVRRLQQVTRTHTFHYIFTGMVTEC